MTRRPLVMLLGMDPLQHALAEARDQVVALRTAHEELVAASVGVNADDEHDPEGATIAFERQQLMALLAAAEEREAAAALALTRRDQGAYGTCERCGQPIGEERLAARPTATLCVTCATATERRR